MFVHCLSNQIERFFCNLQLQATNTTMRFFSIPALIRTLAPSQVIWRMNTSQKKIYLTFDDGPHPDVTPHILSLLEKYNASATFFCLGKNAEKYPSVLNEILQKGHMIGNHSYSHCDAWKTQPDQYIEDLQLASEIIKSSLFRPPFGHLPLRRFQEIALKYKIIMWSLMSYDFDQSLTPQRILNRFEDEKRLNGAIWVFHDNPFAVKLGLKVLPVLLEKYTADGYSFEGINIEKSK
jgi:peptidoglycan-N-acetylglucosamine deacetylase